ncbi:hypothetical protein [Paenibacillus odorifer]|uniref:hypothetical protein n=1 Tax=Paenibacillus odorifer TaxID=189426 RepID=UPI00096F3AE2|nr:hypothetical protein [Paenibacillus odorifer]OME41445.1 hypothetical protein BSK58_15045 [Paenibacillus odorifer]
MEEKEWYYLVKIIVGTVYDDVVDPSFRFALDEKEKMMSFIDTCLENAHEISVTKSTKEFDDEMK